MAAQVIYYPLIPIGVTGVVVLAPTQNQEITGAYGLDLTDPGSEFSVAANALNVTASAFVYTGGEFSVSATTSINLAATTGVAITAGSNFSIVGASDSSLAATGSLSLNTTTGVIIGQSTPINALLVTNPTVATGSANQSSPTVIIQGTYWTGSASAVDSWTVQDVVGSGTNPNSVLQFIHGGSSGGAVFVITDSVDSDVILELIAAGNGGNRAGLELSYSSVWSLEISGPDDSFSNAGYISINDDTSIGLYAGGAGAGGESPWIWWGSNGVASFTGGIQTVTGEIRAGLKSGEGGSSGAPGFLSITDASATHRIAIRQPASSIAADYNFNLPITPGTAGQVLTSQGGGSNPMTWGPGGGSGTPGGSNTQFQYNNAGTFGGIVDLTFTIPHTIAGGASGIFDFSAVSSFKIPVTATEVLYAGTGGAITGSAKFIWTNSTNILTAGYQLTLLGSTSGSASIGAAATAGTPQPMNLPTSTGTSGYVLATDGGSPQQLSWVPQASGGTVTSFSAGNLSPLFTSMVATAATTPALSFALSTQTANYIFAGPTSGSAAAPTFRAMVSADLPAGVGVPGGSNTQFQYNNSSNFGGIADLTFTSPHTIAGGASGIFDFSAVSSFKVPVTATEVLYAGTGGAVTGSAKFIWTNSTNILTAGYQITLLGSTSGSASIAAAATAGTPNLLVLPTSTGTSGYVLATDGGTPQQLSWVPQSGSAGSGTVTSITVSDLSPIFTTGVVNPSTTPAVTFTLSTQTANYIFAGPTSGGASAPTFRAMVSADLPAGVGVPGGSNTQFQYNNSSNFGGIADLTFTSPHTIAGGASGIFDFSAVSSFKLPVTATQVVYAGAGGAATGSANFIFASNILTAGYAVTLLGSTSGSATIGAAATAGSPHQLNLPTSTGTAGYILSTDGGNPQQLSWIPAGSGTVTSFSAGNLVPLFTTGVATAGTTPALSFTLSTQSANLVFAGPTSGSAAGPTFRGLVVADVPSLPGSIITSGIVGLPYGGTGVDLSASGGSTMVLAQNGSHVISARNLVAADIPNLAASKITSGQLALAQGGTDADLSATGGTGYVLQQTTTGAAITVGQIGFSNLTGTIAISQTVLTTLGDLLYVNATPALARLAGNTAAAKQFLTQTGTGSISAAPAWGTIAGADITSGVVALARGGAATDLSVTGGASRVLRQSAVGAVITVSQLSYADISGTPPVQASGTVADGSPIVFDGTVHQGPVTITLNHVTATRNFNVQNLIDGAVYTVVFVQDSTGGAQVVLNTGTTWLIGNNGGGAITLNTTANNRDRFVFQAIGSNSYGTLDTQFT